MSKKNYFVSDIVEYMEKLAPNWLCEDWDNVGLLVGRREREINNILLCLDVTEAVLCEAIEKKVNCIISHHPVIFKKLKCLNGDFNSNIVMKAIESQIAIYSAHTNLDTTHEGVNYSLAKALNLDELENLNFYKKNIDKESGNEIEYGLGIVGLLSESLNFTDFINHVKRALNIKNLRFCGSTPENIQKVAVFCGSFDEDLTELEKGRADILITGDLKYHTAVEISEKGLCVVDAGHFNTERVVLKPLKEKLQQEFTGINIFVSEKERDPFYFL